jgi:hypothetical protein
MSTQQTGARRRSRLAAALAALALTAAVLVLAAQANSISSTRIGPQLRPVPAQTAQGTNPDLRTSVDCWRHKYGCQNTLRTSHITKGCWRRKYGCQQSGTTPAERHGFAR